MSRRFRLRHGEWHTRYRSSFAETPRLGVDCPYRRRVLSLGSLAKNVTVTSVHLIQCAAIYLSGYRVRELTSSLRPPPNRVVALHRKRSIAQLVTAARAERTNPEKVKKEQAPTSKTVVEKSSR